MPQYEQTRTVNGERINGTDKTFKNIRNVVIGSLTVIT